MSHVRSLNLSLMSLVMVSLVAVPLLPADAASDTSPPSLVEFDFAPKTVDTSSGAVEVTLSARLTDDEAGVADIHSSFSQSQVRFVSPSGQSVTGMFLSDLHLVSGTPRDGVYESVVELAALSEQGTWQIEYFILVDQVGNRRELDAEDLAVAGFPTELKQTGPGDMAAPVLEGFDFSPKVVDTSSAAAQVTLSARISDDGAGVASMEYSSSQSQVRFRSPSGQSVTAMFLSDVHLKSGTARDGEYESTVILPVASEQGTWTVEYFLLVDRVGNEHYMDSVELNNAGFPTAFEQVGAGDTRAPVLQAFSFQPVNVDTSSSPADVTLNARITDDGAGVAGMSFESSQTQVRFRSPSGQTVTGMFLADEHLVSGTPHDGHYESTITLPASSEQGSWEVEYFLLVDQAGNMRYLYPDDLAEMGSYPAFAVDPFEDIYETPFFDDIGWLIVNGVTKGCNPPVNDQFCPNRPITRGQMAAFLNRYLHLPAATKTFDDTEGHIFEDDIGALASAGITKGCNPPANSLFCPDDQVTRGQMAAFLSRALPDLPATPVESGFTDTTEHVFEEEIRWLATTGVTKGCNPPSNDRFCPDDPVTRGQMAAFLRRAAGG